MPRDLYKAACRHYRNVRSAIHRETWGDASVERLLLDTDRGLVSVVSSPDHLGSKSLRRSHSRTYSFWEPMTRANARLALLVAYERRLEAAQQSGDVEVVNQLDGRVPGAVEDFLRSHPAYADEPAPGEAAGY